MLHGSSMILWEIPNHGASEPSKEGTAIERRRAADASQTRAARAGNHERGKVRQQEDGTFYLIAGAASGSSKIDKGV